MTILIAYDGSEDAQTAVRYAARHLKPEPAVVMTVWEPLLAQVNWASLAAVTSVAAWQEGGHYEEQKEAEQLARHGAELARDNGLTEVTTRVERGVGPVWASIVDTADELNASLIVTGSRGLAGARSMILGSVSTRVLHHAHRPTLIVPPPKEDD
ncbi:universal stress protein [Actinomadura sp. GC306]|uniref:universal stress protein n=1 Tax=Actinomadura sp. GC306 TaxID=2530367 RepID=UPI00104D99FB|nr:universal stress protein [Actinomadura sp. GC306]TDC59479.1 universal stress protein [Actinomadura sp. GC306]